MPKNKRDKCFRSADMLFEFSFLRDLSSVFNSIVFRIYFLYFVGLFIGIYIRIKIIIEYPLQKNWENKIEILFIPECRMNYLCICDSFCFFFKKSFANYL